MTLYLDRGGGAADDGLKSEEPKSRKAETVDAKRKPHFESTRSKLCRPNPSTALVKISITIPNPVHFLTTIQNAVCAIKPTTPKMFATIDSMICLCWSVCLADIVSTATATASGTMIDSFQARGTDREPVADSMRFLSHDICNLNR